MNTVVVENADAAETQEDTTQTSAVTADPAPLPAPAPITSPDNIVGSNTDAIKKLMEMPAPAIRFTEQKFHFKKDKLGNKRPTITLQVPFITFDGLVAGLSDDKIRTFIEDIVNDQVYAGVRQQIGDESKPVNSQAELDLGKLTLEYLANVPKAERTGGGISKEVWEDFGKDYAEVMMAVAKKTQDQVSNATKILLAKFQPVKTQKPIIKYMKEQLAIWYASTPNAEDYAECYEFLTTKADALLAADEMALLNNL
jgi:hypothetical protein